MRGGTSTRGTRRAARRGASVAMLVASITVVSACVPAPPVASPLPVSPGIQAPAPAVREPVVFIHGFQLGCGSEQPDVWQVWFDEAARHGYHQDEIAFFQYDTCHSVEEAVTDFGYFVHQVLDRTGARKVDIIAHSMGSSVARACIRFGDCANVVDKFDSVAGANHGSFWGNFCGLAFWSRTACAMNPTSSFLTELNAGDETWGDAQYVTMVSACDLTVVPYTSVAIEGALNIVTPRCVSHTDWRSDLLAAQWVFDWFDSRGGQSTDQPLL